MVIVKLDMDDADPWAFVQSIQALPSPPQAVIVATDKPSWAAMEKAEKMGCAGLLDMPFNPPQVMGLLQKI